LPEPAQADLLPHTESEIVMTADPEAALILIVEDNPDMRRFIGEALAGTYRIATAADGNAGLTQALALAPDLILSDIMMPTMSGIQLVQAVRSHPELATIPLVLLTAKADEQLRVEMLQRGVQDYLVKPFSPEELRARLANLIEVKRTRELLQRELTSQSHDLAGLAHEVTLRKRELEQALQEQARLHEETKQALRLRDEFLAIASHELKTPLTSLVGIAQLLARRSAEQDTLSERDRRAVRTIFEQGTRLNQMIEMLFDLARMDRGQFAIKPVPLDLVGLIRRVVEETRPSLEQHTIELQPPQEAVIVAGDALRLEQVFHNLIGNAVKYSPHGGLIQVALERQEGLARITVTDHGMGIPAEALSQLFQRFYRAPNISYHHISGMGVGLYIVQEIIRHHNGWVEVTSTEDEGSTFIIWLPLYTAALPAPEDANHAPHASDNGV
jgi:signal transduction histidine kinase